MAQEKQNKIKQINKTKIHCGGKSFEKLKWNKQYYHISKKKVYNVCQK